MPLPYGPGIPCLCVYPTEVKQKDLYKNIHCGFIQKSQKLETDQVSICRWMDQQIMVYSPILPKHKNGWGYCYTQLWLILKNICRVKKWYTNIWFLWNEALEQAKPICSGTKMIIVASEDVRRVRLDWEEAWELTKVMIMFYILIRV